MRAKWRVILAVVLCATTAWAEPDTFGLGTGRDGALTVTEPHTVINRYAQVTEPLAPGDTSLAVYSAEGFTAGDLVMVLQTTGIVPEPALGAQGPIDLSADPVGRWELARVHSTRMETLKLSKPLLHSYAASVTQVIRVPEYTDVTVRSGASVMAVPWNGKTGGVLAFLTAGRLHNDGRIDASGAGLRAGLPSWHSSNAVDCIGTPRESRPGAHRGEGIAVLGYGQFETGSENASNGGGGGNCPLSGGGGGGNGAAGGQGGSSMASWDGITSTGGRGGAALVYSMLDHLTLGGGGGRGYGEHGSDSFMGAGGGAILIRGHRLTGVGSIVADGEKGQSGTVGGGSGGGAGGSISLRLIDAAECGEISARGGAGGDAGSTSMASEGGGGGGAGGRVLYQAAQTQGCRIDVKAGLAGAQDARGPLAIGEANAQPTQDTASLHEGIINRLKGGLSPFIFNADPPEVVIQRSPLLDTNDRTASFEFAVTYVGAGVEKSQCIMDGVLSDDCKSPVTYFNLLDGWHEFKVVITDKANKKGEDDYRWRVDGTPPVAQIANKPDPESRETTARFAVTVIETGSGIKELKCSLDSVGPSTCPDPIQYPVLSGQHTFSVFAIDNAGNTGPSATYTWNVDLDIARVQIDTKPPNPSPSAEAEFTFSVPLPRSEALTFECILGNVKTPNCESPKKYFSLGSGNYTFIVKARDVAGNMSEASYSWEIDKDTPAPPQINEPEEGEPLRGAPLRVTGSAERSADVDVFLDGILIGSVKADNSGAWAFEFNMSSRQDGAYVLSATAKDRAGNTSAHSPDRNFTLDTKEPTLAFGQPLPPEIGNATQVTFTFVSEPGVKYECRLNSAIFEQCSTPWIQRVPGSGSYTLTVRAIDQAGNISKPIEYLWGVDLIPPPIKIEGPKDGDTVDTLTPSISGISEPSAKVKIYIDGELDGEALVDQNGLWSRQTKPLENRGYSVTAHATDRAGNPSVQSATVSFVVDTEPPETVILEGPPDPHNSRHASFTVMSPEGATKFYCAVDGTGFKDCQAESSCNEADPTDCTATFLVSLSRVGLEGAHSLQVRARDPGGNFDPTPESYSWRVVITPPPPPTITEPAAGAVVSGIPTLRGTATHEGEISVYSSDGGEPLKIGGAPILNGSWEFTKELGEGDHTLLVDATDKADNTSPHVSLSFRVVPPKARAEAIGGGLGCSSAGAQPWLALLGLLVSSAWLSRRRR